MVVVVDLSGDDNRVDTAVALAEEVESSTLSAYANVSGTRNRYQTLAIYGGTIAPAHRKVRSTHRARGLTGQTGVALLAALWLPGSVGVPEILIGTPRLFREGRTFGLFFLCMQPSFPHLIPFRDWLLRHFVRDELIPIPNDRPVFEVRRVDVRSRDEPTICELGSEPALLFRLVVLSRDCCKGEPLPQYADGYPAPRSGWYATRERPLDYIRIKWHLPPEDGIKRPYYEIFHGYLISTRKRGYGAADYFHPPTWEGPDDVAARSEHIHLLAAMRGERV